MKSNKRVLLVDDDPRFRNAVLAALRDSGSLIIHAATIKEATTEVAVGTFDLLIIDGQLPDGDGLTWIIELRAAGNWTPIVFASAVNRDSSAFAQLSNQLQVRLIMQKPIPMGILQEELLRVLECDGAGNHLLLSDDAAKMLREITAEYASELPSRIADLSQILLNVAQFPGETDFIRAAIHQSHALRGTAGIYGFPAVSQCMGWVEDTLSAISKTDNLYASREAWERIHVAVSIARESAKQIPRPTEITAPNQQRLQSADTSTLKVLLLDDDRTFTQRIQAMLSGEGILVYSFLDTECLLDVLEVVQPEALLVDLNMPGRSGLDVCRMVRQNGGDRWKELPILVISASPDSNSRSGALEAGANSYLTKSMVNTELLALIKYNVPALQSTMLAPYTNDLLPQVSAAVRAENTRSTREIVLPVTSRLSA